MFYPFVCGAFQHHQEEEDDDLPWSIPVSSSPRKCSRRKKDSSKKNPYSTRGLEQFSALLAELEEKRQQIYSQMGTPGLVRFVYKNSNDCVPIVVKLKDKKKEEKGKLSNTKNQQQQPAEIRPTTPKSPSESEKKLLATPKTPSESDKKLEKKQSFSWNVKSGKLGRPSYYIPAVIILILVLLTCFGRSVAILFTCVGWYIVPAISGEQAGSNFRTSMKKKDFGRKLSGNKLVSGNLLSSPNSKKFEVTRDKFP
ncbi:hypothetical protein COLO4_07066 [Corchorus olitorius]|uniref:ZCF37 n=1 Tax=Corchorus olitorius TaxID=93759 RepID=A0A1R3KL34_9ROSI|nr:hypothetical protein COLO4_07066 [Corchorus olitorius]